MNVKNKAEVTWPVIIKYTGDDELLYIENELIWLANKEMSDYAYMKEDLLLDSAGALFSLCYDIDTKQTVFNAHKKEMTIERFEDWIKSHLVILNYCCSAKIGLASIKQGFLLLADL